LRPVRFFVRTFVITYPLSVVCRRRASRDPPAPGPFLGGCRRTVHSHSELYQLQTHLSRCCPNQLSIKPCPDGDRPVKSSSENYKNRCVMMNLVTAAVKLPGGLGLVSGRTPESYLAQISACPSLRTGGSGHMTRSTEQHRPTASKHHSYTHRQY